jgi:hypothetical protein
VLSKHPSQFPVFSCCLGFLPFSSLGHEILTSKLEGNIFFPRWIFTYRLLIFNMCNRASNVSKPKSLTKKNNDKIRHFQLCLLLRINAEFFTTVSDFNKQTFFFSENCFEFLSFLSLFSRILRSCWTYAYFWT